MTLAQASDRPKTLRDQARTLRRHARLILITTSLAVAVALGLSFAHSKLYTASAGLNFTDPLANSGAAGQSSADPANLAATGAARATGAQTLSAVKRTLRTPLSVSQLLNNISVTTDPNTLLVTVSATSSSAGFAAQLANADVAETKALADAAAANRLSKLAANYRAQLRSLTPAQRNNQQLVSGLYNNLGRALALSKGGATAADIVFTASPPSAPSSPKPVEDAVVGGVLGLILGIVIAALRETFDRRLAGPPEIESQLGLPILAHVREEALGHIGAHNDSVQVGALELEPFRMLRAKLEFLDRRGPPRTVAVTSARPEEGKTTVASLLAIASAAAGRRTLLVECDLRRPQFSTRLKISASPGLSDFLSGKAELQQVIQTLTVDVRPDGSVVAGLDGKPDGAFLDGSQDSRSQALGELECIPAGNYVPHPPELLASSGFRAFVQHAAQDYELVVIDAAPLLPVSDTLELVPRVDAVLLCVRASRISREDASAARSALDRLPPRPSAIVVTGLRDARDGDSYYAGYAHAHRSVPAERGPA